MLATDPVGSALCGIEGSPVFNLMSMMPLYFAMMIIGIGDSAKHYAKYFLTEGYSQKDLKRLFLGFVVAGGSVYRRDGKYCVRYYGKDTSMHRMFSDLAHHIYGSKPQTVDIESLFNPDELEDYGVSEEKAFIEFKNYRELSPEELNQLKELGEELFYELSASSPIHYVSGEIQFKYTDTASSTWCKLRYPRRVS